MRASNDEAKASINASGIHIVTLNRALGSLGVRNILTGCCR